MRGWWGNIDHWRKPFWLYNRWNKQTERNGLRWSRLKLKVFLKNYKEFQPKGCRVRKLENQNGREKHGIWPKTCSRQMRGPNFHKLVIELLCKTIFLRKEVIEKRYKPFMKTLQWGYIQRQWSWKYDDRTRELIITPKEHDRTERDTPSHGFVICHSH